MPEITTHHTNDVNKALLLDADERDPENGNASHLYAIRLPPNGGEARVVSLPFQHGPIAEVGVNGITNEVLLAILIDRMQGFQSSKYACRENALALTHLEDASHWLEHRTKCRTQRGVEGTHKV